jgi:hypothetical protein
MFSFAKIVAQARRLQDVKTADLFRSLQVCPRSHQQQDKNICRLEEHPPDHPPVYLVMLTHKFLQFYIVQIESFGFPRMSLCLLTVKASISEGV